MRTRRSACVLALLASCTIASGQDTPFSGPQVGERLLPFSVRLALEQNDTDDFDPVTDGQGGPVMIVFVHKVTRPSIGLMRTVVNYANRFRKDGLSSSVIFLSGDPTDAQAFIRRARHAMPNDVAIGISKDGLEGPGAYGLNRKMTLTILIGNDNRITANFALIQPSLAADAPRIGAAIQSVLGHDDPPNLAEMRGPDGARMRGGGDESFRAMLSPVINRSATPEQVADAARAVENRATKNAAFRKRLGEVANRIISAGKLDNYGTPAARDYLQKWAADYGPAKTEDQAEKTDPK